MQLPKEEKNIMLPCDLNGHRKILTMEQAHVIFWEVNLAWLLALDWFRYYEMKAYIRDVATKSTKILLLHLLTRGFLPLTINHECVRDKHGNCPSPNNFAAKGTRLRAVFSGKLAPFIYEDSWSEDKYTVQAFRMAPGQTWLVVFEPDSKNGKESTSVEWEVFQQPPNPKTRARVLKKLKEDGYL
jgi:hypothetical protein